MNNPAQPAKGEGMRRLNYSDLVYMAGIKSRIFDIAASIRDGELVDKPELLEELSELAELVIEYEGCLTHSFMQMRREKKEGEGNVAE